jgi:hypothetical protein
VPVSHKTEISVILYFGRLRQAQLPLPQSSCAAFSAPWECQTSDGDFPVTSTACIYGRDGLCTNGRIERERRLTPGTVIRG